MATASSVASAQTSPEPSPPVVEAPASPPAAATTENATLPADKPAPKWYDAIAFDAFVDAYAGINYNFPKPQTLTSGFGGNQFRAFDVTNGFAIHWAGVNASYAPDPVGGTISLRVGPGARIYAGSDNAYGLEILKQAYASWKPGGKDSAFTLDFGKFDQPYGSEVADTQLNFNYSRSALYNYTQPLFFTGARLGWQPAEMLDVKLILANGWNNSVSPNAGKTAALQVNVKPTADLLLSAGYAVGPQQVDGSISSAPATAATPAPPGPVDGPGSVSNLRHLVDVIVDYTVASKLRFLANGDFVMDELPVLGKVSWYGANLGVRYAVSDPFGIAVRGGYLADPDGVGTGTFKKGTAIFDGTLTLEGKVSSNLIVKLEQRLDMISNDNKDELFQKKTIETSKTQMTTMLGVVVKTN